MTCPHHKEHSAQFAADKQEYTCPMHPEIRQNKPGNCTICGMTLEHFQGHEESDNAEYRNMLVRFWIGVFLTIPLLFFDMVSMFSTLENWVSPPFSRMAQWLLSTPIVLWGGRPFFQRAWHSILHRH